MYVVNYEPLRPFVHMTDVSDGRICSRFAENISAVDFYFVCGGFHLLTRCGFHVVIVSVSDMSFCRGLHTDSDLKSAGNSAV